MRTVAPIGAVTLASYAAHLDGSPRDPIPCEADGRDRAPLGGKHGEFALRQPAPRVEHDLAAVAPGAPGAHAGEQADHRLADDRTRLQAAARPRNEDRVV